MSAAQPSLLPGQSGPVTVVTPTDHSGVVLIATSLGLAFALVSLLIRAYVRHEFSPQTFAWDDGLISAAFILSLFQNAAVFVAVTKGFGKIIENVGPAQLIQLQKALYASELLYIISVWVTKWSVAFLFLRLSPKRRHVFAARGAMAVLGVTGVVAVFITALRCDLGHPWITIDTTCTGLMKRWDVVAAFDVFTELILFAISVFLVWDLQMPALKKTLVVLAFALRLLMIPPIAFRLVYESDTIGASDPTFTGVLVAVVTQVEIAYAIIAATIPCLRPFLSATATNYGAPAEGHKTSNYTRQTGGSGERSQNSKDKGSFNLSSLTSKMRISEKHKSSPASQNGRAGFRVNPFDGQHDTKITHADSGSIVSNGSRQMIIRKDVEYAVDFEERGKVPPGRAT